MFYNITIKYSEIYTILYRIHIHFLSFFNNFDIFIKKNVNVILEICSYKIHLKHLL